MLGAVQGVVIDFAELSDPGRDPAKQINEDASGYAATPHGHLAVVCDGMGGHEAGREASRTAVRTLIEATRTHAPGVPPGLVLKQAVERAGRAVFALGGASAAEHRPGSTCVAVLVHPGGAEIAHAGDSRAYLIRGDRVEQLTRDHSMVQELVASGRLTPEQARHHPEANKITRALGIAPEVNVEARGTPLALERGDVLVLATDGLTDLVTDAELRDVVRRRAVGGTAAVCQELIALANARGGHDNITVLVLMVLELPARPPARGTLIQEPGQRGGTLVLGDAAPAPTLFDDGTSQPGPTLPGVTQLDAPDPRTAPGLAAGAPRFTHDELPAGAHGRPTDRRLWLGLALGLVFTVLAALATWALRRAVHRAPDANDELVPPPEAPAPLRAPRAPSALAGENASPRPSDATRDANDAARD